VSGDGSIFGGSGSTVAAWDEAGAELWSWGAPDDVVALAGPGGGAVFVLTVSTLHALSSTDGGELWGVDLLLDLPGVADAAIAFGDGALFVGGDPMRRLSTSDGSVTAEIGVGSDDVSGIVVDGGSIYVAGPSSVLAATTSFEPLWEVSAGGAVDRVAVSSGTVAYAVRGGGVGAVSAGAGDPLWASNDSEVWDGLFARSGLAVAARSDGALSAFDLGTGTSVWTVDGSSPVGGLHGSDTTVFYAHGDLLDGINLEDGSSLWTLSPSGRPVAVRAL
jgi:outer membrane protein assembly factor BamB